MYFDEIWYLKLTICAARLDSFLGHYTSYFIWKSCQTCINYFRNGWHRV